MEQHPHCKAGRNHRGAWFLACGETATGAQQMLQQLDFTHHMSAHAGSYNLAARHIRANGGTSWSTNVRDQYVTIAGIPENLNRPDPQPEHRAD